MPTFLKNFAEQEFKTHLSVKGTSQTLIVHDAEIRETYKQSATQAELPFNRGKIIVLGDAGVGKTSTCKHIRGEAMDKKYNSTHFMDTFKVVSEEIDSDWRRVQSSNTVTDFQRGCEWWTVSKTIKTSEAKPQQELIVDIKQKFWLLVCFLVVGIVSVDGFSYGFATSQWLLVLAFYMSENFHNSYGFGSAIIVYMASYDMAFSSLSQNTLHLPHIAGFFAWSLIFGILVGNGCRTGVVLAFCVMITAPFENNTLCFFHLNFISRSTILGLLSGKLIFTAQLLLTFSVGFKGCGWLLTICTRNSTRVIHGILFRTIIFVIVLCALFMAAYVFPFCTRGMIGVTFGVAFQMGMNTYGKNIEVHSHLRYREKIFLGFLSGFLFCFVFGCQFVCTRFIQAIPTLVAELHFLYKIRKTQKEEHFPVIGIQEAIRNIAKGKEQLPLVWSLLDFGGQKVYYDMHQLFLAPEAIYLLVFNLRDAVRCFETQYNRILFWLQRIRHYVGDNKTARVFLVGTHRQSKETEENEIRRFALFISERISLSRYAEIIMPNVDGTFLFSTENSIRQIKHDEHAFRLRDAITHFCETSTKFCKTYKLFWLRLLDVTRMMANEGRVLVSVDSLKRHVETIFKESIDIAVLLEALTIADEAGEIIFKGQLHSSSFVVLDPEYLINFIKNLLAMKMTAVDPLYRYWKTFLEHSIAHISLFHMILKCTICAKQNQFYQSENANKELEAVIEYLEYFDFIHELPNAEEAVLVENDISGQISQPDRWFIMPSTLKESNSKVCEIQQEPEKISFIFDFGEVSLDQLYPCLTSRCLPRYVNNVKNYSYLNHLYRNMGIFLEPNQYEFSLELTHSKNGRHLLKVCVWMDSEDTIADNAADPSHVNPWDLALNINRHLKDLVRRYFADVTYTCGIECDNPACTQQDRPHILNFYASSDSSFPTGKQRLFCCGKQQNVTLPYRQRHTDVTDNNIGDSILRRITAELGFEWETLSGLLKVPYVKIEQIKMAYPHDPLRWSFTMLRFWRDNLCPEEGAALQLLKQALRQCERTDLVDLLSELQSDDKSI